MSLFNYLGLGCVLLALLLAPMRGGFPAGALFFHDLDLSGIRLLTLVGIALLPYSNENTKNRVSSGILLLTSACWSLLSLLVHSKFLTAPTLLFAMVPATINSFLFAGLALLVSRQVASTQRLIIYALLLGAALVAGKLTLAGLTGVDGARAYEPFFSANFAAGFVGLCAPLALVGLFTAEKPALRIAHGALAALCLTGVAATGSRSALVLAIGGLVLTLILLAVGQRGKLPWPRLLASLGAGVVLAGLIGFAVGAKPLAARAAGADQEQSNQFRKWTWKGTAAMAKAAPALGHGPGTFPYRYPAYAQVATTGLAHNSYLELAAEQGTPALLLTLTGIGLAAFAALRRVKTDPLAAALLGALAIGMARNIFDSEWAILGDAIPFFTVVGLCCAPTSSSSPTPQNSTKSGIGIGPNIAFLIPMLISLLSIPDIWPPVAENAKDPATQFAIEPSLRIAMHAAQRAESSEEKIAWFEKAHSSDPTNSQAMKALAEAYEATGEKDKALTIWQELASKNEGPMGTIRAISEATDTSPAWAYAVLGQWSKVTEIIERYSKTALPYQEQELILAPNQNVNIVIERRERLKILYRQAAEKQGMAPEHLKETLDRIDTMLTQLQ
ncbi:MAG: O-antigen ligase family protein [Armatimonas sp.]